VKQSEIVISRDGSHIVTLNGLQTETLKERLGGLLVKNKLAEKEGLWLTSCSAIHTCGMKYSLDLIYVDRHDRICGISANIKPWRMSLCLKATATIEVIAGSISQFGIREGDNCIWQN